MVRELVGLKTRLFWNGLRTDRQRQVGLPLILGFVSWIAWRAAAAHDRMLDTLGAVPLPHYLAWTALVVFVAWVALPVVIFPVDDNLDPQQLGTLPISRPRLVVGLTAAALVSPPVLVVVALMTVTVVHAPAAMLLTVPAAAVFVIMLVVGSQAFTTLISAVLHSRRGRDLAVFLIMGIGLGSFAGYQAVRGVVGELGVAGAAVASPLDLIWWAIPPAAPAHAVSAAWAGNWAAALGALAVSILWVGVLMAIWERVLRWILVTPRQESGRSSVRRSNGMSAGRWEVPFMMARKELRFYVRDPRQRLVWTGTVIFVGLAVAAIVVGSEGFARFRTREWLPVLAPVLVLMVGLPVALNQFGWERNAASYLFALPAKARSIILGKNLAAMTGLLIETVFLGILFSWFSSGWKWLWLVVPLALGAVLCLLAVGNIVSILTPLRLPREGTDLFAQATEQGLLALASQVVSFFVIGLLLVIPASAAVLTVSFGQVIAPWITGALAVVWGLLWYGLSMLLAGWLLNRRIPEVVGWVQVV
jgi:ABC-2 type transport system permease protein